MENAHSSNSRNLWKERGVYAALLVGASTVFGPELWNKIQRTGSDLRNVARDQIPLDVELTRARQMVADMLPGVRQSREVIIRTEQDLQEVQTRVDSSGATLEKHKHSLLKLKAQTDGIPDTARSGDTYQALLTELAHHYNVCQAEEAQLATHTEHRDLLQRRVNELRSEQTATLRRIRELIAEVDRIESRMRLVEAEAQQPERTAERVDLARCDEQIAYLRNRLSVAEQYADSELTGLELELAWTSEADREAGLIAEVDAYFAKSSGKGQLGPTDGLSSVPNPK